MMPQVNVNDFDEPSLAFLAVRKLLERPEVKGVRLVRNGQILGTLCRPNGEIASFQSRVVRHLTDNPNVLSKILTALSEALVSAD